MEYVFGVAGVIVPIFVIAGVVSAIVFFIKRDKDKPFVLDFNHVFRVYFYLIMTISILTIGFGLLYTSKNLLSKIAGMDFSYREEMVYDANLKQVEVTNEETGEVTYQEPDYEYEYQKDIDKKDLITGLSCIIVAIPIFLLHAWGLANLEKKNGVMKLFRKIYFTFGLVLYAIISLIALPTGVYMTLQYFLTEQSTEVYNRVVPGESLSVAIAFVPIWIYYFVNFNKIVGEKE